MGKDASMKGLTVRSYNCLYSEGLHTKEDVQSFVLNGKNGLCELLKIPNMGKVSFKEVVEFLGLGTQDDIDHKKDVEQSISFLKRHGYKVYKEV